MSLTCRTATITISHCFPFIQYAMPCRLKGIHYINVPHFFEYMFSIVKQFLSEKIQKRVS